MKQESYKIIYEMPKPERPKKYRRVDFAAACSDDGILIEIKESDKDQYHIFLTHKQMMKFKGVISQAHFDYWHPRRRKGKLIKTIK